ncbi:hypothetical protein [uncultured Ruthenibacterium sp.]|uniref:hypothetical protein n=1 Tax=uncultured Ruthenibacterium sp. TaxID=1905347 RepID=UPI00349E68C7
MKRIKSACLCQTLHFKLKDEVPYEQAVQLVDAEVETYKATLNRQGTLYKILQQTRQADGSMIIKLVKQYNRNPVGDYLK